MLKLLRTREFLKVISIFLVFILVVGCATVKPPRPISLNQATCNKPGEKRDIAIVGIISETNALGSTREVDITKTIKKIAKTQNVDCIDMGNIIKEQSIKDSLKEHYKALILTKSDIKEKKIKYTIKVFDLETNKTIYEETSTNKQVLATIVNWCGLLIDIPCFLILFLPSVLLSTEAEEFDDWDNFLLPVYVNLVPAIQNSNICKKFKKPAYICREIVEGKYQKPSNLNLIVEFNDKKTYNPNNILEAGETGELTLNISNMGNNFGTAYDTHLEFSCNNQYISIISRMEVGDIIPGKSKEITIPIQCALDAIDGNATITIYAKEKRGYDAQPVQIVIPVRHIEKPNLVISDIKLNDANLGLAKGNGNNIPENEETIELIVYIENTGKGVALGSTLDLDNISSGITIIKDHVDIGKIEPGSTEKAKVVVHIPREFPKSSFEYIFSVKEVRGACPTAKKNGSFSIGQLAPMLKYTFTAPNDLKNGGSGQMKIVASNDGHLDANGVILKVTESESDVTLENSILKIGTLQKGNAGTPLYTTIYVQRTFSKPTLSLTIELTQEGIGFNQVIEKKTIPITLVEPELRIVDRSNLNNRVMQNTIGAELVLSVDNIDKLDAHDVKISVYTAVDKVNFRRNQANIGTVRANASSDIEKFIFDVPQSVVVGEFSIQVKVSQSNFPSVEEILNYEILERGALVTTIEPEKTTELPTITYISGNQPPEIVTNIQDGQIINSSSFPIDITVFDNDGLASVNVSLNGRNIFNSQTNQTTRVSDKSIRFSTTETYNEGDNIIEIIVEDNQNIREKRAITINYERTEGLIASLTPPFSDVDVNFPKGKTKPNSAALIIGISSYMNASPALYADRDAMAFSEYCKKTIGIPEENIITLINEKATLGQIKKGVIDLKRRISGGNIYIFYSGHGIPDLKGNPYLLPYDGEANDPEVLPYICYPMAELYNFLNEVNANHTFLFIDACFSGIDRNENSIIAYAKPTGLNIDPSKLGFATGKITQFSSSMPNQFSTTYEEKRHGLFSYYLLKGLSGEADKNNNKKLTIEELSNYVTLEVTKKIRLIKKGEQNPTINSTKLDEVIVNY